MIPMETAFFDRYCETVRCQHIALARISFGHGSGERFQWMHGKRDTTMTVLALAVMTTVHRMEFDGIRCFKSFGS